MRHYDFPVLESILPMESACTPCACDEKKSKCCKSYKKKGRFCKSCPKK